jgi:hypothetical protein
MAATVMIAMTEMTTWGELIAPLYVLRNSSSQLFPLLGPARAALQQDRASRGSVSSTAVTHFLKARRG